MSDEYYAKTTRAMLAAVKEVGAMPFVLFEYYLTWQTASEGIKPSLERICADLDLEKNAVCNLRSRLVKAGWIRYENGQIFILKSFTKNESRSQKMKDDSQIVNKRSQKMNESFTKNESPYKEENKQLERTEKEQEREGAHPAPEQFQTSARNIRVVESEKQPERTDALADCEALQIFENSFKVKVGHHAAEEIRSRITNLDVWRILIRDKIGFADKPLSQRQNITNWIFTAYDERIAKLSEEKNGKNQQYPNGSKPPTHADIIRNRSYRRNLG